MYKEHFNEEINTKLSGRTLRRIFSLVKTYPVLLLGFILLIMATALLETTMTYITKGIIDNGLLIRDSANIIKYLFFYLGATVAISAAVFGFIYCAGSLGEKVQYSLRKKMFGHLQELSFSYFDKTPVGWLMSRMTSDVTRVSDLVTWGLLDTLWSVTMISSAIYYMVRVSWSLALVVAAILPVLVIVALKFQKIIIQEYRRVRSINSRITTSYNENITGVRVIKALVREKVNLKDFDKITQDMYSASFRASWLSAIFLPAVQIITALGLGAVVWYGGLQVQGQQLTIGGIQAFVSYIVLMMWPVQELARVFASMQQSLASAERIFSLVDTEAEIQEQPGATPVRDLKGSIRFQDVGFYYQQDKPVLQRFNLAVKPGETIALVGPTGGGKSTILNLICRFYEPRSGNILVNGTDYTLFTQRSLQSRLGVVLQTPHLFSGTIKENIRYGRIEASDQEIIEASRRACAHEFIQTLAQGYDSEVGEEGLLLSVGQKQLISLARAVLAKPDIFIMDEATSSIDTLTENLIQKGLDHIMRNSTCFIVAHRLSTIRRADRILVIEKGTITEMGTHGELIKKRGKYHDLYRGT